MKFRFGFVLIMCMHISVLFIQCKKELIDPNNNPSTENEFKPNANHLILYQNTYGSSNQKTTFWRIETTTDNNFFVYGLYDGDFFIGKLSSNGNLIWKENLDYRPRSMKAYKDHVLVCGATDVDTINTKSIGYLSMFDGSNGSTLSQKTCDSFEHIQFNDLSDVYIVGLCVINKEIYPMIGEYFIDQNNKISFGQMAECTQNKAEYFRRIDDEYIVGASTIENFPDHKLHKFMLYRINIYGLGMIKWSKELEKENGYYYNSYPGNLLVVDQEIFVAGITLHPEIKKPADGGEWKAGLIGSFRELGDQNYLHTWNPTKYSDYYYDLYHHETFLYACGQHSYHFMKDDYKTFGYGFLSKFNAPNGLQNDDKTFGDARYESGFNSFVVLNDKFYCVGWTNHETLSSGFQAWFAEIEMF